MMYVNCFEKGCETNGNVFTHSQENTPAVLREGDEEQVDPSFM